MQLHKRLSVEEVRLILDWYGQKLLTRAEAQAKLDVKQRRFFSLLKQSKDGKLTSLTPVKSNEHRKIPKVLEQAIRSELDLEKRLICDPNLPVTSYNYAAVRDTIVKQTGLSLSAQTVRNRAKDWGYYHAKPRAKQKHTRVVLTTATGLLLQHDTSHHLWSPFAEKKWSLITTIDDYSRLLVFADLFEEETTWAHIQALKHVVLTYGVGSQYYTDNHSMFRFVNHNQSRWRTPKINPKDVKTQWERAVKECGMGCLYAMSPEAKGKVERPYRWLQDRLVRGCAKAGIADIAGARDLLKQEVLRYNTQQVHSTTGEIPLVRFQRAKAEGKTVFRQLTLPEPYTSAKDIFCLKDERTVTGYGTVVWYGKGFDVPKFVPEGAKVQLHIIPDSSRPEIRLWYKAELVTSVLLTPTNPSIRKHQ